MAVLRRNLHPNVAEYHNMIFLQDEQGLYVNLLVPSEVEWTHGGEVVRVRQETDYPEAETSRVTVTLDRPAEFALHFRVPGWSSGATMTVNGEPVLASFEPGDWATIQREWQSGDVAAITIPMALRTVPVDHQHPNRSAIMYGPVVLAQ